MSLKLIPKHLWVMMLVIFSIVGSSTAQTAVPPPFDRRFFTLGGRTDHVIFFATTKEAQTLDVQEALITSFRTYQPLFGAAAGDSTGRTPFQIVVWVTGLNGDQLDSLPNAIADANYKPFNAIPVTADVAPIMDAEVCEIRVYNAFSADTEKLATIAHEFAHCYQAYYNPDALADATYRDWWVEGGAEWLASLVYPEAFPTDLSSGFYHGNDIITGTYYNVYFWLFAASPKGAGDNIAAARFMINVPQDAQAHRDYLDRLNPNVSGTQTFHEWMLALARHEILYNPPFEVWGHTIKSASGGTVMLSTLPFSGDRVRVQDIKVEEGNRATVTAIGVTDPHYGVSALIGSAWVRLGEGITAEFCPQAGELELLVSRANGVLADRTEFTLRFDQTPSPTPCDKTTEEPEETVNCVVGTWVVKEFPVSIAIPEATIDTTGFTFTFGANGAVEIYYGLTATLDSMTMRADIPFSGTYTQAENGQVTGFSATIVPGGSYTGTYKGVVNDFTKPFYETSPVFDSWSPVSGITCNGDTMSWETQDGMGSFVLQRVTP